MNNKTISEYDFLLILRSMKYLVDCEAYFKLNVASHLRKI